MNCMRGCLLACFLALLGGCITERTNHRVDKTKPKVSRIAPNEAKARIESGAALLVCAYDSVDKFQKYQLQGAISLQQLQSREDSLAKEQEIIFYCA